MSSSRVTGAGSDCLLALDINSSRTGYMFGGPQDGSPRGGVWHMPSGSDLPRSCGAIANSISALSGLIHPSIVVIEAPLQMTERSAHTALVLTSLYGAACGAAYNAGARVIPGHVQTWRKHFIQQGNLKSAEAKERTLERCKLLGWKADNHDEGDACGLWSWGMATNYPKWSPKSTPLFSGART